MRYDSPVPSTALTRLVPHVREFRVERSGFSLGSDLENLLRVRSADAHEAAVFYGGRIVEACASSAVRRLEVPESDTFGNLLLLEQVDLLAPPWRDWGHALRRLGNDARHLRRAVRPGDADAAVGLVTAWLDWFFIRFERGDRLPALTLDGGPFVPPGAEPFAAALASFEASVLDAERLSGVPGFWSSPVLPSFLAEKLVDARQFDRARALLVDCDREFPGDLRTRQLLALTASRSGDLEGALAILRPLAAAGDDEETLGILGGALKRSWDRLGDRDLLRQARRSYRRGFEHSRRKNVYLGVNAATTALLDGALPEAQSIAARVRDLLTERKRVLGGRPFEYWNQVTVAEALLLCGQVDEAWRAYRDGLATLPEGDARGETSLRQASVILAALGLGRDASRFADPPPPALADPVCVGITGHRDLVDPDGVRRAIAAALRVAGGGRPVLLLTSLAEGADRLAARAALEGGGRLHAVLPVPAPSYVDDFGGPASVAEFSSLLGRASRVTIAGEDVAGGAAERRLAAYEASGRAVVDGCDVLVAVWDGAPSRGRGGTAEIVAYARERGRKVTVVAGRRSRA